MEKILSVIEKTIFGIPMMFILLSFHIYFTIKLKFPQRKVLKELKLELKNKEKSSDITPIKSLMTVLAGTLGTGNIIGIASAIIIGGPGSIFWIFLSGILAMATKYAETYIVLKNRNKKDKKYIGGAMYILDKVLDRKVLALVFSISLVFTSLTMGAMMQSNSISFVSGNIININSSVIGIMIVILAGYIVFGNERRIAKVSSFLVPIATIIYLLCAIFLIIFFKSNILVAVKLIICNAFDFKSVGGGILASSFIISMREGLNKGLFTNEAGIGTSPLFDKNVETSSISKQSIIASFSVFIDTVFLCSITGIIFVASGVSDNNPSVFASKVFEVIPYGKEMLSIFLNIFAFSTIPCVCYYGTCAIGYLFKEKKAYKIGYKIWFLVMCYIGAKTSVSVIFSISTISNIFLMIPNLYMLWKLRKEIKME